MIRTIQQAVRVIGVVLAVNAAPMMALGEDGPEEQAKQAAGPGKAKGPHHDHVTGHGPKGGLAKKLAARAKDREKDEDRDKGRDQDDAKREHDESAGHDEAAEQDEGAPAESDGKATGLGRGKGLALGRTRTTADRAEAREARARALERVRLLRDGKRDELKQMLEAHKLKRAERRAARFAALKEALAGKQPGAPLEAELRIHARRVAQLSRIGALAQADGKQELVGRVDALMEKEQARHDRRMAALAPESEATEAQAATTKEEAP